jgi:hypothetical protein
LYTLSSRQPQRKKSEDEKSEDWGATGSFKGLSCSEAKTHTVKTRATQRHLLRPQHITHAQFCMNRQCFRSKFHLLPTTFQELQAKTNGYSIWIILYKG